MVKTVFLKWALQGKGINSNRTSYINSGWMIQSDGTIQLNTPFAGFTRRK
jgi:hypothetical protein